MAPAGFEPAACRLSTDCSAVELKGQILCFASYAGKPVTSQNAEDVWRSPITGEAYKTGLAPLTAVTAGVTRHRRLGVMDKYIDEVNLR